MKSSPLLHIVRLARRLNNAAAAAEKKTWSLTDLLNDLKALIDGAYKFVLMAGILPTVAYLLFSIKFYPSGVTLGDGFFFLMVGVAFGLMYLMLMIVGLGLGMSLQNTIFGPSGRGRWIAGAITVLVAALIVYLFYKGGEASMLAATGLLAFGTSGFLIVVLQKGVASAPASPPTGSSHVPLSDESKRWLNIILWIITLIFPVIFAPDLLKRANENVVMKSVGLRSPGMTLKLSEENYNILASAAKGQYLAALGCNASAGSLERVVHGVTLLWHGIGERSLIEIPGAAKEHLVVELKRDGVFFFRNYSGTVERCLEVDGDVLFNLGSSVLTKENGDELAEMIGVISKYKDQIAEIRVVGHADAVGFKGGAKVNNRIAQERATQVRNRIVEKTGFQNVKAEGHGAREPKTLCKDWPVKDTLSECLAVNRRVEVRMKFKPSTANRPSAA